MEQGDLYRLESPYDNPRAALDYVSSDRSHAVLFVYQLEDARAVKLAVRGLDPNKKYLIHEVNLPQGKKSQFAIEGQIIKGSMLMEVGIIPPCQKEYDSAVFEFVAEK